MDAGESEIFNIALPLTNNGAASKEELRTACFRAVLAEFNPIGLAETLLARDIARRAAQMLDDERCRDAAERQAEQSLTSVLMPAGDEVSQLGSHISSLRLFAPERLEALARADLRNSDAFFHRLRQLTELQRDRDRGRCTIRARDHRFESELQCLTYLSRRYRMGDQGCRRCGQVRVGSWIPVRRCWQCSACNTQTCHRFGTVMERSHVALVSWFHAIAIVLYSPRASVTELAAAIGVRRTPTVRTMLHKIHSAIISETPGQLFAGLDAIYLSVT